MLDGNEGGLFVEWKQPITHLGADVPAEEQLEIAHASPSLWTVRSSLARADGLEIVAVAGDPKAADGIAGAVIEHA